MNFRFTLLHDDYEEYRITAPDGWNDAVLKLERDKNFHSLVEYFDGSFIFYGQDGNINGGVDFIREIIRDYGFDADLTILVEITFDDFTYQTVFEGLLKLEAIQETDDNKIQVPIIRNDFWSKFINRMETAVNLHDIVTLDLQPSQSIDNVNLKLPTQKIQKTTRYEGFFNLPSNIIDLSTPELDANGPDDDGYEFFSQAGLDPIQREIDESFSYPFSLEETGDSIFELIEMVSESGLMHIHVNTKLSAVFFGILDETSVEPDPSKLDAINTRASIQIFKNGVFLALIAADPRTDNGPFAEPIVGFPPVQYSVVFEDLTLIGDYSLNVEVGDYIAVKIVYDLSFDIDVGADTGNREWLLRQYAVDDFDSVVEITIQSEYRETQAESFLVHDAGAAILNKIVSRDDVLYSEFLGSTQTTARQYDGDGCGWKYALAKGLQLRRYSLIEKPFFLSFKTWWDGINPILNLGLGYEIIDDQEVIRVEEQSHFYDSSEVSINIDNVRQIRKTFDQERIFKTVKIGYKQWQSENISGIDDAQTKHTYASRLQKSGTDITLESEFIAASLAIETTRRTTREKSADYKFDNETFIIALNPIPVDVSPETSPDVTDYSPELDENFTSIENLLNPETRYNSRITPARNFLRWLNYLSGGLQSYLISVFKFTSGEGNYDMVSDMSDVSDGCDEFKGELSEKQDIQVSNDYINLSDLFDITIPLEWEEYLLIRENRKKAIGISQTDANHVKFFIKELNYEVAKSEATITAWPVEYMQIAVIESQFNMLTCEPSNDLTVDNTIITVDSTVITVDQTEYTI